MCARLGRSMKRDQLGTILTDEISINPFWGGERMSRYKISAIQNAQIAHRNRYMQFDIVVECHGNIV